MGVRTGVVDWYNGQPMGWSGARNNFYSQETGGINEYDFSVAFNLEDRVYLGLTIGAYDLDYKRYTSYTEDLLDDNGSDNGGYTVDNNYHLEGTGVDVKFGAIVRPIEDSPFRLGFAVHTPTWYDLSEYYNASLSSDIYAYDDAYSQTMSDFLGGDYRSYDYRLVTPWKFNVSAGTTVANILALDAEYEYQDYSTGKLKDIDGYELDGTYDIQDFLKGVSTVRVGMEARLAPEFSVRAGYNYVSSAFDKDAYASLPVYGTSTQFCNTKAKHTVTVGLGYRGSVVYADLAYKYDIYKSDFYAFDDIDLSATKVDNTRHQLLFTLGAKF
jgi:long-subunit fatty acid transport protein